MTIPLRKPSAAASIHLRPAGVYTVLMSGTQADILVRRPRGPVLAVVEVKNLPQIGVGEAAQLKDAFLSLGLATESARYLLIVTQRSGFIWQANDAGQWAGPPDQFEMTDVLREYFTDAELDRQWRGSELEIVIAHWLADLSRGRGLSRGQVESGLLSRFAADIRGAEVQVGALH